MLLTMTMSVSTMSDPPHSQKPIYHRNVGGLLELKVYNTLPLKIMYPDAPKACFCSLT